MIDLLSRLLKPRWRKALVRNKYETERFIILRKEMSCNAAVQSQTALHNCMSRKELLSKSGCSTRNLCSIVSHVCVRVCIPCFDGWCDLSPLKVQRSECDENIRSESWSLAPRFASNLICSTYYMRWSRHTCMLRKVAFHRSSLDLSILQMRDTSAIDGIYVKLECTSSDMKLRHQRPRDGELELAHVRWNAWLFAHQFACMEMNDNRRYHLA